MFSAGTTWLKPARALRLRGGLWFVCRIMFVGMLVLFHTGCGSSGSDADPDDKEAVARAFMAQLVEGTITPGTIGFHEIPEEFVQDGKALYTRYGCTVCHGLDGHGDGPISYTLKPPPRDFRDPGAYRIGRDVVSIAGMLKDGIPDSPSMVPFPHIKDEERFKIAMYVASLQPSADAPSFDGSSGDTPSSEP
ncbi:MAG: cytochrome c [Gemmatimonadota bacterium]|nr:cytochrome c [Gemmatimonadota bacterium]